MGTYRKKPVVIEAYQYVGARPTSHWPDWLRDAHRLPHPKGQNGPEGASHLKPGELCLIGPTMFIRTLEGTMSASFGDWIIRGVKGEIYPCKPDIFEATYEPVEGDHSLSEGRTE